jgi:succinoglycan biosynthesis protein ExoA
MPFISVIVPVRNEEQFVGKTLQQLLRQHYDPARYEVLVVDGESNDTTRAIVHALQLQHANLKLFHNPRRLASAARNVGVRQARGEFIVFVDGHCDLASPDYLRNLAEAFQRSGADCLGRPQPLEVAHATSLQQSIAAARASWLGHHPASWIYSSAEQFVRPQSVAAAYHRSVFQSVGFFDEGFDACEDVEFNHRLDQAGSRCYFTPRIQLTYYPRATLSGLFRQMTRYGRGRMRLLRKHPDTFSLPSLVPAFFVLGLLAGPIACWWSRAFAGAYFAGLVFYMLVVAVVSVGIAMRARNLRILFSLPLVFAAIHLACGVGAIRELLAGGSNETSTAPAPAPSHSVVLTVFSRLLRPAVTPLILEPPSKAKG